MYKGACDGTVPRKIKSNNNKLTSLKGGEFGNVLYTDRNYESSSVDRETSFEQDILTHHRASLRPYNWAV